MELLSMYLVFGLGVAAASFLISYITWHAINKTIGLIKFGKILVEWVYYRGKCKECRINDAYTPEINKEE